MRQGNGALVAVLRAVAVVALAAAVAVLAGLLSRAVWRPENLLVPWGLTLGVAASLAVVVLARSLTRALGFAAAGGWLVGLVALLSGRREGDYVIASDSLGLAYLGLATSAVLAAALWRSAPATGSS